MHLEKGGSIMMVRAPEGVRIGLISRLDYFAKGFREKLLHLARIDTFDQKENTQFDILIGGLICRRSFAEVLKEEFAYQKEKNKRIASRKGLKPKKVLKSEVYDKMLKDAAKYLAEVIPVRRKPNGSFIRFYLMVSPAYDGKAGMIVAQELAKRRDDIRFWSNPDEHFSLQNKPELIKSLACLVPRRTAFKSKYYSTSADSVVEEYLKRITKPPADVIAVGCYGSHFLKPTGEKKRPYFTVPNLSVIDDNRKAENQIGACVLEIPARGRIIDTRIYPFNDLIAKERESINISAKCSPEQKKIMEAVKEYGDFKLTEGELAEATNMARNVVGEELKSLLKMRRIRPRLVEDQAGDRYGFPLEWVQRNLSYALPSEENVCDHRLTVFGCLHSLAIQTQHKFFVNEVAEFLLERDSRILIGAGDFDEGMAHNLSEKGQIIAGANYTQQDRTAARMVATVIVKVFKRRFETLLKVCQKSDLLVEKIRELIEEALILFLYIPGNHDMWVERFGIVALEKFRDELVKCVRRGIVKILIENDCPLPDVEKVVESKIVHVEHEESGKYRLPCCGIDIDVHHLHMARTKTLSIRSQELLDKSDAQIIAHANFHVALDVAEWDPVLGQRFAKQVGTIKSGSQFEDKKGKKVDFGIGYLRFLAKKEKMNGSVNSRIIMTESAFMGEVREKNFSNDELLNKIEQEFGIWQFD